MNIPGVTPVDIDRWITAGLLRLSKPGSGIRRRYPAAELRAIRALDSLRRLGGASPNGADAGVDYQRQKRRVLQVAVAAAARDNPPGTIVEVPTQSSCVRVVVVVPEP